MKRLALCLIPFAFPVTGALAADLTVQISGLRNSEGNLSLCLWSDNKGFPDCGKSATTQSRILPARSANRPIVFKGLKPGTYAVSVLHDENANGRLDTNFLGIPKEGAGISNNALPKFSAPRFKDAAFQLNGDTVQTIQMGYF